MLVLSRFGELLQRERDTGGVQVSLHAATAEKFEGIDLIDAKISGYLLSRQPARLMQVADAGFIPDLDELQIGGGFLDLLFFFDDGNGFKKIARHANGFRDHRVGMAIVKDLQIASFPVIQGYDR